MIFQDKIREIAFALLNTAPERLQKTLATIPDGETMQSGYVEKVRETLKLNDEIKQILIDKFSNFSFDDEIPYIDYGQSGAGFIYSDETDASVEDVFWVKDKSQLTKFGATQLDIDLYVATCKLQVKEMERLLKLGANPKAKIYNDGEEWETLDRVAAEAAYLGTMINLVLTHDRTATVGIDHDGDATTLISLGLYEMMYAMLIKYYND